MKLITQTGYDKIIKNIYELKNIKQPLIIKIIEESRPIGVSDEFPQEYLDAMEELARNDKKITELSSLLSNSLIFNKSMIKDYHKIGFGATVTFINCDTNKKNRYTIVGSYESDINNNLISIEAPFVKEMLNMSINDYFYYNDNEYLILSIEYNF